MRVYPQPQLLLGTAKEIGVIIANMIYSDYQTNQQFIFPDFSFTTASELVEPTEDLQLIAKRSESWYGVRYIQTGFDEKEIVTLLGDYFGGGCAHAVSLWLNELECIDETADCIATLIKRVIEVQEDVDDETIYIVDFTKEE